MDHTLLRSWLGLPSGPWPSDHYALLGIEPSGLDPKTVERRVLDLMARVRPHQLLHPDLVTEGMNRLAQALVCLTDPVARAAYDAAMGIVPAIPQQPASIGASQPGHDVAYPGGPSAPDTTQVIEVEFARGLVPPEPLPPAYELVEEPAPQAPYEVIELPVVAAVVHSLPPVPWQPATRRQLFARLASVRRLRSAWTRLQPVLADPHEPLDRPVRVLAFLETVETVRQCLRNSSALMGTGWSGNLVTAILRQTLTLDTIRALLPDQRRALSEDLRRTGDELSREYGRLRELVRSGRHFRGFLPRHRVYKLIRWAVRNPEFVLVLLAGIALLAAVLCQATYRE